MRYDGNIRTENRRGRRNMTEFIASPMFARWFLRHPPQRSLLLCSPFLRGGTLERVLEFVGFPELRPEMELKVLFRGLKRDFLQGASDLAAVELLRRMERQLTGFMTTTSSLRGVPMNRQPMYFSSATSSPSPQLRIYSARACRKRFPLLGMSLHLLVPLPP